MRIVSSLLFALSVLPVGWAQPPATPDASAGTAGRKSDALFTKKDKNKDRSIRDLVGLVLNPDRQPVPGALVRLRETNTGTSREMVTDAKGMYRFSGLKRDLIFQVSAEFKGRKTNMRSLTPFDERDEPNLDLTLAPAQPAPKNAPAKESKK